MLFASSLALLLAVVVWVRDADMRRWPERAQPSTVLLARAGALVVSLNVAVVGVLLLGSQEEGALVGRVVGIGLVVGASLLLAGIAAWRGPIARPFRAGGWLLVAALLLVPSTLTLLLLVVAPLLFLLGPAPARRSERVHART